MVATEYKLLLPDDLRIGDTIMIMSKTSSGWKGMINNKHEIVFELSSNNNSAPYLLDGWILVDVNDRWEKMWICLKDNPFHVGIFKSEQEKIEKLKKNEGAYLEPVFYMEEMETIQSTNAQNPPIKFSIQTASKTYSAILPARDNMVSIGREISKALRNRERSLAKPAKPTPQAAQIPAAAPNLIQYRNQPNQSQSAQTTNGSSNQGFQYHPTLTSPRSPAVQIQLPPTTQANSNHNSNNNNGNGSPSSSQLGGGKWLNNIKNIVTNKAASSLNVAHKGKDSKKTQSVVISKSASDSQIGSYPRNTQNISLAPRDLAPKERKMLTRVYWSDGTFRTVPVSPTTTAKEVCELATKKTKVAIFENLFCLFECYPDGSQYPLDSKTNVYDLLLNWGEESENHLVCDLNLDTKNTVKSQLRKTTLPNPNFQPARPTSSSDSLYDEDDYDEDLDGLDDFDSEEHKSIEMMIQEMIKLKRQLQEEDEMIEQLAVEEQQVDLLISRLANL